MKKLMISLFAALMILFLFACDRPAKQENAAPSQPQAGQADVIIAQEENDPGAASSSGQDTSAPATLPEQPQNTANKPDTAPPPADRANSGTIITGDAKPDTQADATQANTVLNVVYLSITGADDQIDILPQEAIELVDGETVFALLLRITKLKKIQMEFSGSNTTAYVKGIDNLYEFDMGEGSGWMVSVNGSLINQSSGLWKLDAGDIVEWNYTKDLGQDIGARS